jgi:CubicO group peptidase (beta-lactamase class C family)
VDAGAGVLKALVALLALLIAPTLARAEGWQESSPEAQGMSSQELANLVTFGMTNGMDSLLITRHGRIVAEAHYAPFRSGVKHRINSATKAVVGSLVAIALKDGLLKSLDQPVLDFFPDRGFANLDERKRAITLRHLLDMTSGLDWNEPLSDATPRSMIEMERSPDWVRFILDHRMAREPGAAFDYNSGNPHLLSAILSKVTGRSTEDYAREKLFGPLGIEDVQWRRDPQGVSLGGYGLYLLPHDMAKLGLLWLRDGVWNGQRLLPAGWIDKVRHAVIEMGLGPELRYGNLFWSVPSKNVFMAVGFHRQLIAVLPKTDIVAVFTGGSRYSSAAGVPGVPRYPLSAVVDRLRAAVKSDKASSDDPGALTALANAVAKAAQEAKTETGAPSPPVAAISGKVYRLQPNQLHFTSLTFSFDASGASYADESEEGQRFGGPIGLDGLYGVGGHRMYGPSAAKGKWLDSKTFQIEVQTLGNDDASMGTFTFEGRSMSGRIETLSGRKFDLKGEADE